MQLTIACTVCDTVQALSFFQLKQNKIIIKSVFSNRIRHSIDHFQFLFIFNSVEHFVEFVFHSFSFFYFLQFRIFYSVSIFKHKDIYFYFVLFFLAFRLILSSCLSRMIFVRNVYAFVCEVFHLLKNRSVNMSYVYMYMNDELITCCMFAYAQDRMVNMACLLFINNMTVNRINCEKLYRHKFVILFFPTLLCCAFRLKKGNNAYWWYSTAKISSIK